MHRLAIDAAREILERVAHQQRRDAAGVFDVLDAAIGAAARFGQRLAVLARDHLADAIEVFLDQLPVAEEQTRALDRRRVAPGRKSVGRGFDGVVHDLSAAHRHFGNHFAARRIVDGRRCQSGDSRPFAADEDGAGESDE